MKLTRPRHPVPLRDRIITGSASVVGMTVSALVVRAEILDQSYAVAGLFACAFGVGLIGFLLSIRRADAPPLRLLSGLEDDADSD